MRITTLLICASCNHRGVVDGTPCDLRSESVRCPACQQWHTVSELHQATRERRRGKPAGRPHPGVAQAAAS
jgi:hypothetical protein